MRDPKGPVKSYKSPEELAKKHKVSLKVIEKQVRMGTKVEGEHTTDPNSAKITALQHIDEFPDYYTKLKKVEKTPKTEQIGETKFCRLCRKFETQEDCSYGPTMWERYAREPLSLNQMKYNIATVHPANEELLPEDHKEIASGKIKDEEGYMAQIELDAIEKSIEILREIIKKPDQQLPAWVQSKITRAADFITTAAEYLSSDNKVSESNAIDEEEKGLWHNIHAKRKCGERPAKPGEKGYPKTLNIEETDIEEGIEKARKNVGASKCWSGKKLGNPPTKMKGDKEVPNCVPESISIEDAHGNHYAEFVDIIKPESLKPSKGIGSKLLGEKKLYSNWREEFAEDWQSVNRKDKTDGLSPAAVKAYRRENPGSKLQTAVTEKNPSGKRANRRKNFCSRMSGMKDKLTSAETARDPDSRINKALRRWNCN